MENNEPLRKPKLTSECQERVDFVNGRILRVDPQEFQDPFVEVLLAVSSTKKAEDCFHHKSEEERVKVVKEMFKWSFPGPKNLEVLKKYQKNSESSKLLRDHGNGLFRQRNFREALHYYNMALLFGLGESLGLAFANRAAVWLELGDPASALEDIALALKHSYPQSQTQKLEQRKLKCIQLIEKTASQDASIKHLMDEERSQFVKIRDTFGRLEKRNPRAPAAAEFVEIEFEKAYGRRLVVTRDVPAGTLLMLEDPFVGLLENQLNWDTEHCHHCFKLLRRGVPCEKCVFAFYCSDACRQKSLESTHQFECCLLPHLHLSLTPDYIHQALKVMCKVGAAELYRLFSTRDPAYFSRKQPFGTLPEDRYESDSYLSVFHLQSHPDRYGFAERTFQIHNALLVIEHLDAETEFFGSIPAYKKNEFKDFIAAMMVHHVHRRVVNSLSLTDCEELEDFLTLDSYLRRVVSNKGDITDPAGGHRSKKTKQEFASGMYPLLSLANHSCAANAFYINHATNGTMSVIASRRIKKGEQILIPYACTFLTHGREVRQAKLRLVYNFECECIACRNDWPIWNPEDNLRFCCSSCSMEFCNKEKDSVEFLKCELKAPSWMCRRCGQRYNGDEVVNRFVLNNNLCDQAAIMVLGGQYREGLQIALKLIDYFQLNLIPPGGQTYMVGYYLCMALTFIMQVV